MKINKQVVWMKLTIPSLNKTILTSPKPGVKVVNVHLSFINSVITRFSIEIVPYLRCKCNAFTMSHNLEPQFSPMVLVCANHKTDVNSTCAFGEIHNGQIIWIIRNTKYHTFSKKLYEHILKKRLSYSFVQSYLSHILSIIE